MHKHWIQKNWISVKTGYDKKKKEYEKNKHKYEQKHIVECNKAW